MRAAGQAERALQLGAAAQHRRGGRARRAPAARGRTRGSGGSAARGRARPGRRSRRRGCGSARSWSSTASASGEQRLGVPVGDRLVGEVPAGQHDRRADLARRAGGAAGCRAAGPRACRLPGATDGASGASRPAAEQDDRRAARGQRLLLDGVDLRERARGGEVGGEDGERLVLAVLARAQRADGGLVGGERGEVVAAEALDGDDGTRPQRAAAAAIGSRRRREVAHGARSPWRSARPSHRASGSR